MTETTPETTPEIGHNGGPPLTQRNFKKRWALAVFAHPQKPAGAVALAFKLYMEMDSHGRGAVISDREFADCCGVSERACQNFKKWLIIEEFVHIHVKGVRGRSNAFIANIPGEQLPAPRAGNPHELTAPIAGKVEDCRHVVPVITPELTAPGAGNADNAELTARGAVSCSGLTAPRADNPELTAPRAGNPSHGARACKESPSGIVIIKKNNISPQTPQTPLAPEPMFDDPYQRVAIEDGKLNLVNGLRQFWLEKFQGDEISLDLALLEVSGQIQPHSRQPLEAQVSSKLARMVRDRIDKDKRYSAAVKRQTSERRKPSELYSPEAIERELLRIQSEDKR